MASLEIRAIEKKAAAAIEQEKSGGQSKADSSEGKAELKESKAELKLVELSISSVASQFFCFFHSIAIFFFVCEWCSGNLRDNDCVLFFVACQARTLNSFVFSCKCSG